MATATNDLAKACPNRVFVGGIVVLHIDLIPGQTFMQSLYENSARKRTVHRPAGILMKNEKVLKGLFKDAFHEHAAPSRLVYTGQNRRT